MRYFAYKFNTKNLLNRNSIFCLIFGTSAVLLLDYGRIAYTQALLFHISNKHSSFLITLNDKSLTNTFPRQISLFIFKLQSIDPF